ncbi:hypothetical protein F4678DRAFT_464609 [Xylaria arbuscula]|nr:hypothetical protein F4678DRAFT_464609 [Xylaria arbuscula]
MTNSSILDSLANELSCSICFDLWMIPDQLAIGDIPSARPVSFTPDVINNPIVGGMEDRVKVSRVLETLRQRAPKSSYQEVRLPQNDSTRSAGQQTTRTAPGSKMKSGSTRKSEGKSKRGTMWLLIALVLSIIGQAAISLAKALLVFGGFLAVVICLAKRLIPMILTFALRELRKKLGESCELS